MLSKMWDVDAKFAKEVSLNPRKGKMQMQLYMTGRLKSICKFKEKQVADTLIPKRASAITNIKGLQIQRLQKIIYLFLLQYTTEHCSLIHWICDNVLRKNIGYEFL